MNLLKIINGRIVMPGGIIPHGTMVVGEGKILQVAEGDVEVGRAEAGRAPKSEGRQWSDMEKLNATTIDAQGMYVAPGFIDIHVH
jgi:N-acetylglucosamine-6-phosphate deacetylase